MSGESLKERAAAFAAPDELEFEDNWPGGEPGSVMAERNRQMGREEPRKVLVGRNKRTGEYVARNAVGEFWWVQNKDFVDVVRFPAEL